MKAGKPHKQSNIPERPTTTAFAAMSLTLQLLNESTDLYTAITNCKHQELADYAKETPKQQILALLGGRREHGETLLHQLAGTTERGRILYLLESVALDVSLELLMKTSDRGDTLLHTLAYNAQLALLLAILGLVNRSAILSLLKAQNEKGETVAHALANCGPERSLHLIELILNLLDGGERLALLKINNLDKHTAIHVCIRNNDPELALKYVTCLAARDRLSVLKCQTGSGLTAMHLAVNQNNAIAVRYLLETLPESAKPALLDVKSKSQRTAFDLAVKRDFTEPLRLLLPHTPCHSSYMLHRAATHGSAKALDTILETMADEQRLNALTHQNSSGRTALHLAVKHKNFQCVRCIVNSLRKGDLFTLYRIQDKQGQTIVHMAVANKDQRILRLLLNSINVEERVALLKITEYVAGNTALHMTLGTKQTALLKLILDTVMDIPEVVEIITKPNLAERTVLQNAISAGAEVIQALLSSLDPINRLNLINEGKRHETEVLLNHVTFNSAEANELAAKTGKEGNTFLHVSAKSNHYETTCKFLSLLSDENRRKVITCVNSRGKTAYQQTTSGRIKNLLTISTEQKDVYYMPSAPQALIMYSTKERPEAEEESRPLEKALAQIQVKPIVKKDLKKMEMLEEIRNAATSDECITGLLVVVMGHGVKGGICAEDGDLRYQDILTSMCDPALEGKPKMLLAQSCQGQDRERSNVNLYNQRYHSGASLNRYDPKPSRVGTTTEEAKSIAQLMEFFCKHANTAGKPPVLHADIFEQVAPESLPKEVRASVWNSQQHVMTALHHFLASQRGLHSTLADLSSSDTDKTHFDVIHKDMISLMATVNGGLAMRCKLVPIFAKYLEAASPDEDIHSLFLKTHKELQEKVPEQILEFRSTMTKKVCLTSISSKQPTRPRPSPSLLGCMGASRRAADNNFGTFRRTM